MSNVEQVVESSTVHALTWDSSLVSVLFCIVGFLSFCAVDGSRLARYLAQKLQGII